ncbi:MAG: hypothetical protein QM601_06655, partial [Pseudoxanthomonas sp.]
MVQRQLPPEAIAAVRRGDPALALRLLLQAGLDLGTAAAAVQSLRRLEGQAAGAATHVEAGAQQALRLAPGLEQALARGDLAGAFRQARQAFRDGGLFAPGTAPVDSAGVAQRPPSPPPMPPPAARPRHDLLSGIRAGAQTDRRPTVEPGDRPGRGLALLL